MRARLSVGARFPRVNESTKFIHLDPSRAERGPGTEPGAFHAHLLRGVVVVAAPLVRFFTVSFIYKKRGGFTNPLIHCGAFNINKNQIRVRVGIGHNQIINAGQRRNLEV